MGESYCYERKLVLLTTALLLLSSCVGAGVIKDLAANLFKPNRAEGEGEHDSVVKQSSPICGHNIFSTSDQRTISPEFIFITTQASHISSPDQGSNEFEARRHRDEISEVAKEYRFHVENVTLEDLERHGFNRDAPTTFLMHGFTSGYPLQAWISAIVESYTIDRENKAKLTMSSGSSFLEEDDFEDSRSRRVRQAQNQHRGQRQNGGFNQQQGGFNQEQGGFDQQQGGFNQHQGGFNRPGHNQGFNQQGGNHQQGGGFSHHQGGLERVQHNLFIINWNYASRGILYPRAVANIPKVATFATRFINEKLLREAGMDSRHIQLIGHSLGAHLAGFIGKNTRSKVGRIYGLDPAGPCFGTLTGSLYPSSQRLAPTDAEEVITIQTNSALLGIDKPLGRYSIYVEGGAEQPGCKGSTVIKSISALTFDGNDFDDIACSHSRAPNLLTYRIDQTESQEDCQMVAYECKDWDSFVKGQCGICYDENQRGQDFSNENGPMRPVDCYRIGLDWQYSRKSDSASQHNQRPNIQHDSRPHQPNRPHLPNHQGSGFGSNQNEGGFGGFGNGENIPNVDSDFVNRPPEMGPPGRPGSFQDDRENSQSGGRNRRTSTTRRPGRFDDHDDDETHHYHENDNVWRRNGNRNRRAANSTANPKESVRQQDNGDQGENERVEPKKMFLRTTDTQPYCTFHYQLILELNEPFPRNKRPPMSLVMQDSQGRAGSIHREQNTITNDNFGEKYDDRTYTHLLTSTKKARRIDHATLIFREGLSDGQRILKSLQVNYMSNRDPEVRRRLSARLCLVHKDTHANHREGQDDQQQQNRFYFEPCNGERLPGDFGSSSRPNEFENGREPSGHNAGNSQHQRPHSTREPFRDQDNQREPWTSGSSHNREPWNQHNNGNGGNDDDSDQHNSNRRPTGRPGNQQVGGGRRPSQGSNNGRQPWDESESPLSGSNSNRPNRKPWENAGSSITPNRRPWDQDESSSSSSGGRQPWNQQNGGSGSGFQGGRRPVSQLFDDNRQPWNNQQESPLGGRGEAWSPPRSPRPSATDLLNPQGGRDRWTQGISPLSGGSQSGRQPWDSSPFNPRDPRLQNSRNPMANGGRQPWNQDSFRPGSMDPWNQGGNSNENFEEFSRSLDTNTTSSTGNSTTSTTTTTTLKPTSAKP